MTAIHAYLLDTPEIASPTLNESELDIGVNKVLARWTKIRQRAYPDARKFEKEMHKVATQSGDDVDEFWGYTPPETRPLLQRQALVLDRGRNLHSVRDSLQRRL